MSERTSNNEPSSKALGTRSLTQKRSSISTKQSKPLIVIECDVKRTEQGMKVEKEKEKDGKTLQPPDIRNSRAPDKMDDKGADKMFDGEPDNRDYESSDSENGL
ncbi:hypothetical protein TCE0_050r18262 [Talaromyces pinophilus]|uniref:Uncharacterized protein n=1 Tax=Talaromyces pinophilus TaxID=128442 RepID=A0A0B8N2N6_TALPI|nr:hypothetical protein TCE0_050r18262 [Talaromyces pinophilus]